jgi:23S rRNA-/tRNA-specific pseudouridylate synthase
MIVPIIGDRYYGTGNKNTAGMKLSAASLRFRCPFLDREVEYVLPEPECTSKPDNLITKKS